MSKTGMIEDQFLGRRTKLADCVEAFRCLCHGGGEPQARSDPLTSGVAYRLSPIDDWEGWSVPSAHLTDLVLSAAKRFPMFGWEGDVACGPYMAPLLWPRSCTCRWMVALKQWNNGETYLWSPVPLPYLQEPVAGQIEWQEVHTEYEVRESWMGKPRVVA